VTPAFRGGAVVHACDIDRVGAFYAAVADMSVVSKGSDHILLECDGFRITVVAIPGAIASTIVIDDPPVRREDTALKLSFPVSAKEERGGPCDDEIRRERSVYDNPCCTQATLAEAPRPRAEAPLQRQPAAPSARGGRSLPHSPTDRHREAVLAPRGRTRRGQRTFRRCRRQRPRPPLHPPSAATASLRAAPARPGARTSGAEME
jgi:hypothetical protein